MDPEGRQTHVLVAEDQLSLAIGKEGQNVRLAARLTGWKIDIKDSAKYDYEIEDRKISEVLNSRQPVQYDQDYEDQDYEDEEVYESATETPVADSSEPVERNDLQEIEAEIK